MNPQIKMDKAIAKNFFRNEAKTVKISEEGEAVVVVTINSKFVNTANKFIQNLERLSYFRKVKETENSIEIKYSRFELE